jgi:hypothetical protein
MTTATIVRVYETGRHEYDETNREMAYRVLLSNGRRCWIVGYGGDYVPAAQSDLDNIVDRHAVSVQDDGSDIYELARDMVGTTIHAYRNE